MHFLSMNCACTFLFMLYFWSSALNQCGKISVRVFTIYRCHKNYVISFHWYISRSCPYKWFVLTMPSSKHLLLWLLLKCLFSTFHVHSIETCNEIGGDSPGRCVQINMALQDLDGRKSNYLQAEAVETTWVSKR